MHLLLCKVVLKSRPFGIKYASSALMSQVDSGMTQIVTNSSETLIPAENEGSETIIHSLSFMFLHKDKPSRS